MRVNLARGGKERPESGERTRARDSIRLKSTGARSAGPHRRRRAARSKREASDKNENGSGNARGQAEGKRPEEGELTCYDGPENENNETKQCRADVTAN